MEFFSSCSSPTALLYQINPNLLSLYLAPVSIQSSNNANEGCQKHNVNQEPRDAFP